MRFVLLGILCSISVTALASDCRESLVDCREDCLLEFGGSVRLDMKHRYANCLVKCSDAESRCTGEEQRRLTQVDGGTFRDAGMELEKPAVIEVQLTRQPDAGVPVAAPPQKAPEQPKPPKKEDDHDSLRFY